MSQQWNLSIAEAQKQLAQEAIRNDPQFKNITKDHLEELDAILWRYLKLMPWHAAAGAGIKRLLTFNPAIPTACVGWHGGQVMMVINAGWFFGLTLAEQVFVLSHEIEHVIRMHIQTIREWPEQAFPLNFCMDALINTSLVHQIHSSWDKTPKHSVSFKTFLGNLDSQRGAKIQNVDENDFIHNFTAEELLNYLPEPPDSNDQHDPQQQIKNLMKQITGGLGEFFDDGTTPDELKQAITESLIDEAEKTCGIGSAPGYLKAYIKKVKDKTNRDWRKVLRGIGYSTRTAISQSWGKINRRQPFLRPGRYIFTRPPVLLVIDRSGSVSDTMSTCGFIAEMNGLVDWVNLDVIFVDAGWDPTNPQTFRKGLKDMKDIQNNFVDLGGGTCFQDVYNYLLQGEGKGVYETVILLTDGFLADHPLIPGRLAKNNVAILTPSHDEGFATLAKNLGFQVVVMDDSQRKRKTA